MKRYRVKFCNYTDGTVFCFDVKALHMQDAIDHFFNNYSGMLLGVEFIDYL